MAENNVPKVVIDNAAPSVSESKTVPFVAEVEEASAAAQKSAPTLAEAPKDEVKAGAPSPWAWVAKNFPGHEHAFVGGACGLLLALLIFAIGFWKAFFVAVLVAIGVLVGQYLDGDTRVVELIRRLFGDNR